MANPAGEKPRVEKEIWLVYPLKHTGKRRISYNDAVEEALCFGWIDSIIKKIDAGHVSQRFTPRRSAKSDLSETNKERVRRLIRAGLMTPAGLAKIQTRMDEPFVIPADILRALKRTRRPGKTFRPSRSGTGGFASAGSKQRANREGWRPSKPGLPTFSR